MKTISQILFEGGNVKVGEHVAEPIDVGTHGRQNAQKDIHGALSALHDSFFKEHGHHLYGENKAALMDRTAFSGSTKHLFNKDIEDDEFLKHKAKMGDVDSQVPKEHAAALHAHLAPGKKLGKYTIAGVKKHGNETSAIMQHENGSKHQFDFEHVDYTKNGPTPFEQFAHSSDWHDTKNGVKGAHHKQLLNAIGGEEHKFSITHGLRSRKDENDPSDKETKSISAKLFGAGANHEQMSSFHGLTQMIKKHVPPQKHQDIYNKFKSGLSKNGDHGAALAHMRKHLNVKDSVNESTEEEVHHTTVIPQVGFQPHAHMGHATDLGGAMHKLPGTKHVGISGKSSTFTPAEHKSIIEKQWGGGVKAHVVKGAGETIANAHDSLPKHGKKVLHLLVGHDRKDFAHGLKKSLEAGKVKEMEGKHFDEIHIHHPEDENREHGMSGTKMRDAAHRGDLKEYHRHLGSSFSKLEARTMMKRVQNGIKDGSIPLKRPTAK